MQNSKIEWCDDTSNFVTGCEHDCGYCYARRMAHRIASMDKPTVYRRLKDAGENPFHPALHLDVLRRLKDRLKNLKEPRRIFIASMGDVCCKTWFHRTDVRREGGKLVPVVEKHVISPGDVLQIIYNLCWQFQKHTFLLLSKNPKIFQSFIWPDNAHLGTSVENTETLLSHRLPDLFRVNARVRWVSVEPLLDATFPAYALEQHGIRPNWVVVGGLSGKKPLPEGCANAAEKIVLWGQYHKVPIFCKDNLPLLNVKMPQEIP